MPQLPVQEGPSVAPSGASGAYFNINASPDAFGAGVGRALEQTGGEAQQAVLRQQAIVNEGNLNQANNQALKAANELMYGRPADPSIPGDQGVKGYKELMGKDAVDAYPDYQKKLTDAMQNIRTGLAPAVQRQFDAMAMRIQRGTEGSMGEHNVQQAIVFNRTEAQSQVALYQKEALNDADDSEKFKAALANVVLASERASQIAGAMPGGLETDVSRNAWQQAVSEVYEQRTEQMMTRDPIEAAKFYQDNIGSINPLKRHQIESQLKTTTDAQYSRGDGMNAYHTAIGQATNNSPLPAKVEGAALPALDGKRISDVVKFVKAPSQYDPAIEEAARAYNVSPAEIKLKIAIESGGNPKAIGPALKDGTNAVGLGQFTEKTALEYGITDRTDPVQAINGIAKYLAAHGGTVGGDMSKADRAYIGTGPDAEQYVENTRVARQALYGPQAPAPLTAEQLAGKEADVIAAAKTQAQQRRPGDAVYSDQVVQEARKNWSQDVQALRGQDYANYSQILGASVGPQGAKSLSELPPDQQLLYAKLSPEKQHSLQSLWRANQNEGAVQTPETDRKYLAIMGQAISDPLAFKSRDIAADIQDLPKNQQNSVMAAFISVDKQAAQGANYTKALAELRPMLQMAKIHVPTAGAKGNFEDYEVFAGKLKTALDGFTEQNKRQPNQRELDQLAAPLLADFQVKGQWFGTNTVKGFKITPEMESRVKAEITPDEQQKISSSFQKVYGRQPEPAEAQQLYLLNRLHPGDRQAVQQFDQAVRQNTLKLQKMKVANNG